MALLNPSELQKLLSSESITAKHPWDTNREDVIDAFYKIVCDDIIRTTGASSKIAWDHYGSGYASFIDAWFYKTTPEFGGPQPKQGEAFAGLAVLFSRLSSYYVFLEGHKYWYEKGGSGYLPYFESVDEIPTPAVATLAREIQPILDRHGLQRLSRADVSSLLPAGTGVRTILCDPPFKVFDALFHWED